LVSIN